MFVGMLKLGNWICGTLICGNDDTAPDIPLTAPPPIDVIVLDMPCIFFIASSTIDTSSPP